jgi:hypothetical protein
MRDLRNKKLRLKLGVIDSKESDKGKNING